MDEKARGAARWWSRWLWPLVGVVLATFAGFSYSASLSKGVSFDEGLQLAVGYKLWVHDDYRVEGANGDFVKRWATLPYLFTRPNFVARDDPRLTQGDSYELGRQFLFEVGNRPESLLRQGRAMIVLLGVAAGLLVFWFAREVFGPVGGLVALLVYVTSPHILAFSAIVSTDMSIALALFGSTMCVWQLLHRVTVLRVVASLAFFALLLLAKMTAVIIFPITAVLLMVRFLAGRPLAVSWRKYSWILPARRSQVLVFGVLILLHAVVGWTAIWAHHGFRFEADPAGDRAPEVRRGLHVQHQAAGPLARAVMWTYERRILPEGYCRGIDWLLGTDGKEPAFMDGRVKLGSWRSFFPYAIWVKTQPSLFFLLSLGLVGGLGWGRRRVATRPDGGGRGGESTLYSVVPHLVLIVVYLGVAVAANINIGHRHVLPVYLPLYVLAGAAASPWLWNRVWAGLGVSLLLGWRGLALLAIWPHPLAYFAPQVGGPDAGYKLLVDSSLDWGMDLPSLKKWVDRNNPGDREPLFLAYFGTDSPRYHGIKSVRLPSFRPRRERQPYALAPGYYAISATLLNGNYLPAFGHWNAVYEEIYQSKFRHVRLFENASANPGSGAGVLRQRPESFWREEYRTYDYFRFGRLCAWLRIRGDAPRHIGHSILIWKLSYTDLHAALLGPPPETYEPPADWLKFIGLGPLDRPAEFQVGISGVAHSVVTP